MLNLAIRIGMCVSVDISHIIQPLEETPLFILLYHRKIIYFFCLRKEVEFGFIFVCPIVRVRSDHAIL
jgi:hypothetical protein